MGFITTITKNYNPQCCIRLVDSVSIKLILCEGGTKELKGRTKIKAGEIMFEFPDCVVCHANSFFLGKPIPILSIHDYLVSGNTYFVLPLDRLPDGGGGGGCRGGLLSAASLCSLGSPSGCPTTRPAPMVLKLLNGDNGNSNNDGNRSPFEYIKDKDGGVLMIKVVPEFITKIINTNCGLSGNNSSPSGNNISATLICTTPELQKQYEQLVRAKEQAWSPRLETISEHKIRFSPSRFIRLEWKQRVKQC